jgi:hypothetical protein
MLRRTFLLRCVVAAVVLTISGIALSGPPAVTGPVQQMDYDVTTDVLLGMPNGLPPLTSFQGALGWRVALLPADLSTFPPNPCAGVAAVWNGILADRGLRWGSRREALRIALEVMATNECPAQIVRDESTTPPTIVSITPIGSL